MKLEIDLSDHEALIRKKQEFLSAIRVIDAALDTIQSQPAPPAPVLESTHATNPLPMLDQLLDGLPKSFRSSDVYEKFPDNQRMHAKNLIRKAIDDRKIKILERGLGRRATTYEKIISA
jgi:hypothetical protein